MRRTALFESWRGRYDDSPRAISERLALTRPDLRRVWVVDGPGTALPSDVDRVVRHTPAHFRQLVTARYVVDNDMIPRHYVKSPRSTYLQTWHGTPLKRIGFDVEAARYAGARAYHRRLARDVRHWDLLLSPSPWCTEVFRRAFHYAGRILDTGYPRNDVLLAPDAAARRLAVRRGLGLPVEATVVLYAPTWRDDPSRAGGHGPATLADDLRELVRRTDDTVVVLARMHRLVADRLAATERSPRLLDVSDHPDIAELYLAADVLVTDYSSAMFDFAVTGKPMVFWAYDLAPYRDEVRGFYFDLASDAPGPVVATIGEVAELLAQPAALTRGAAPSYAAFVERFCAFEDGRATERVVDAVFGPL